MDLSNDLISKFVKITSNQSNNKTKEGTAYGTIVEFENKMYVKLDGSDLLTPINSTSDVKDGERVTIMIKDHNAVVTGNITSPSASSGDVKKVTQDVTTLGGEIAEFETIVAKKVGVDELDAEVARINDLIAGRATIEDLNATNAEIVNLQAKDAEIVNLVAGKAEIGDLTATNAEIEHLKAKDAEITSLVAGKANISDLTAINADIVDLKAKDIETDNLIANKASIGELNAVKADINDLQADKADIGALNAAIADIETLTSDLAIIDQAVINKANITDLNAANAQIAELQANKANVADLNAANANINTLDAEVADIQTLVNGNLTSDNIASLNLTSANTTIQNAMIQDAMIDSVTASKIKSGTIDTNLVTIQSTDGSMILTGSVQQFKDENGVTRIQIGRDTGGNFTFILYDENGTGVLIDEDGIKSSNAIADGLIVDAKVADNANIAGSKLDIASVITEVNNDNSTTIKSNKIYLDEQGQSLEVAFNSLKTQVETIQDVTIDGDLASIVEQVQSNTTKIEANKEGISALVAENTIRKEEIQNLDGEIESVNTTLSNKYSSLEQDISGFKTTVADTYTTKSEFNNLQIGGRNLATLSNIQEYIGGRLSNNRYYSVEGTKIIAKNQPLTSSVIGFKIYTDNAFEYVVSGYTDTSLAYVFFTCYDENDTVVQSQRTHYKDVVDGKFILSFNNIPKDTYYFHIGIGDVNTANYFIDKLKIEKGNKATDYTPAPEDIQGQIDATNNNLANNYSTTSAMNSAIQQKANEITSSVSETYTTKSEFNNLQIGGTNTFKISKVGSETWDINYNSSFTANNENGFNVSTADGRMHTRLFHTIKDNGYWTVSFKVKTSVPVEGIHIDICDKEASIFNSDTNWSEVTKTVLVDNYSLDPFNFVDIEQHIDCGQPIEYYFKDVKVEKGNKPTAWSPAPEDVQGQIDATNNNLTTNYSTTSQMNSAIQQKANEITSSVSETYTTKAEFNNLEVGGANLVYNGGFNRNLDGWNVNGGSCGVQACTESPSGYMLCMDIAGYGHGAYQYFTFHDNTYCTDYVVSFYAKSNVDGLQMYASMEWDPATNTVFTLNGGWQKCVYKFRRSNPGSNALVFYSNGVGTGSIYIHSIKMEKGTVPSAWSPHPSEIDNKVNDLSNNLANNYSTTSAMNSAIQQKANEITSSVSQTYTTKSEFNNLSNNLANNYSTTSAMNSAIQQKANEITSSVSQTYTTKSEFNNLEVGGRNLLVGLYDNRVSSGSKGEQSFFDIWNWSISGLTEQNYVISFEARADSPINVMCYFYEPSNTTYAESSTGQKSNAGDGAVEVTLTTEWKRYWVRWQHPGCEGTKHLLLGRNYTDTTAYIRKVKFEKGSKATDWSPAPEDVQGQIDATNANLQNNYSTTSQMNSAIQQKANEIISSVSETYISNYEAKKLADTTTTGLNKYLFERYRRDGFDYGTRPTLNDLVGARLIVSQLVDSPPAHTSDLDNNYIGVLTFYLYYDYACTKTVTVTTDDNGTVYLNNVGIYELSSCQPANVTFNMIKGLNRIDIIYAEGGGGDGVSWGGVTGWSAFGAYANAVTNEIANRTNELTLAMTQGNMLYTDPTFRNGENYTFVYNNLGNNTVIKERIAAIEGCPNTSGYCLKITTNGEATPGLGGFAFGHNCRYNAVFITKITAKIPVGYSIEWASNGYGNNGEQKWLSSKSGTGDWYDYYCKVKCGDRGDISNTNYFYLSGPQASAENPVTWYVSYATVFDVTDSDERITNLTNNLATNYSTTTQMNSAIQQKANEITSSVSQTYTTKSETTAIQNQITTSRNLLMGSRDYNLGKWGTERATILDEWYNGTRIYTTSVEWASMDYYVSDLIDRGVIELFTPYTFSCYVMSTGSDYTPNIHFYGDGLPNYNGAICGTASTSWQRVSITIEWSSLADRSYGIRFEAPTASPSGSHLRWACFQLERGRVATGWAPAPEDAQYGINDVNNNLTNNYSTTSAMNSAIQQKANEITSSVSQTYATKSETAMMNDTVVGNRKWLFEMYTNNQQVGIGGGNYPTIAHLANETLISSRLVDGLPGTTASISDYYIGVYTVYLYYESAYTWSGSITSDDESTTYLNGVAVCQAPTCTPTPFTMNFKKGINKLQIIHGEGGGGDGVTLSDLGPWKEYGAYPACVTAASSNHYASNSDIVQTANDLTIKFTESGGYNLLQNGHADKGTSYWVDNGGGLRHHGNAGGGATGNFFGTDLPHGISYYDWVKLLPNTHYVYQAKVWSNVTFNGEGYMPLHLQLSSDGVNNNSTDYTVLDYQQNISTSGTWTQCYVHFVTGNSSDIYIRPFIYHPSVSTSIYVTELMLSQSRVVQPWSPHPSEIYSGITQIDKDGVRVQHSNFNGYTHMSPSGFYINHNGTDVAAMDASGLRLTGSITATSGQIAHYTINEHALVGNNVGLCGHPDYGYWALWAGSSDSGSAPFRVGHGGQLYATNATISGTITASSGQIGGNTTIDGNCLVAGTVGANAIAAGSITADKLCVGDTNNYCQLTKGVTLYNRYGHALWSGSGSHYYWASSSTFLPFTVDGTRNPFKEGDIISFNLDIYCESYAGNKSIGVWFYSDDNNGEYLTECTSSVEILAGWNNYKFDVTMNNAYVKAAKTIAILAHIDSVYTEVRNVVIRRKVTGELIVDGSITADKIAADAITGKTITGSIINGGTISGTHISGTTFTSAGTEGNSNQYQTMTLNSGALMMTGAIVGGTNDGQEANRSYLTSMGLVVKDSSYNGFGGNANVMYTNTGIYWNPKTTGGEEYPNWQQLIGYYDDYVLIDRLPLRMPNEIFTSGVATSYTNLYIAPASDGEVRVVDNNSSAWGNGNRMIYRPIRASEFYRNDGNRAYINTTGDGTLTSANRALVSNGIRTNASNFYIGVDDKAVVSNKNGYNDGKGITYKPIMASAFQNSSDLMFKKNIRTIDDLDIIDILNKVDVYRYDVIGGDENEIGLIAQACPSDLISGTPYDMDIQTANEITDEDRQSLVDPDNGGASVNLYHMASILWKVCKEQQKRIERLEELMKGEE